MRWKEIRSGDNKNHSDLIKRDTENWLEYAKSEVDRENIWIKIKVQNLEGEIYSVP